MLTLGIETSGQVGGVALLDDARLIEARTLSKEGHRHAQSLVKEIDDLLRARTIEPGEVDLVAVSIGSGSFTGLRVGVVFAKTWCYATGAKLAAVDTLQAAAVQTPADVESVYAISDAQRGELYVGVYRSANETTETDVSGWKERDEDIFVVNAKEFAAQRTAGDVVTGPALDRYEESFAECRVINAEDRYPKAETVARLGRAQANGGDLADFWTLEPFYIRKSAAEEKLERGK